MFLKISQKLTGKHLCCSLFFNKLAGSKAFNFIKKETPTQVFSSEYYEIFKNTFFTEHLRWLLLNNLRLQCLTQTEMKPHLTEGQVYFRAYRV